MLFQALDSALCGHYTIIFLFFEVEIVLVKMYISTIDKQQGELSRLETTKNIIYYLKIIHALKNLSFEKQIKCD